MDEEKRIEEIEKMIKEKVKGMTSTISDQVKNEIVTDYLIYEAVFDFLKTESESVGELRKNNYLPDEFFIRQLAKDLTCALIRPISIMAIPMMGQMMGESIQQSIEIPGSDNPFSPFQRRRH